MRIHEASPKKSSADKSNAPIPNPLASRPFAVQPKHEETERSHETKGVASTRADFSILNPQGGRSLPVQPKLTIGQAGDRYEQEADRVASQVVKQINSPDAAKSSQGQSVQRQEEPVEELQRQPSISDLQRSPLPLEVQREAMPAEEELQAKSILKRREAIAGGEASTDLESAINSARGSGQSLDAGLQRSMGQAMGADFSGVKVHTDAQSDQLNQSIQAKAFTTGQDVFFRQGEYNPESQGGQELIAHELTHVVQQTQKANDTNLSTKKAPARTARPLKIQRSHSTVQRQGGYKELKKSEDPEVIWHKALGKELVATYRILSQVTEAMGKGKNKEALRDAALGLAKAGLSVATMLSGIPGLTEGTDVFSGDIVLNTGPATIGQEVGKTGGGIGLGALETRGVKPDVARGVQNTTTGGVLRGKIYDKVGTLNNVAKTLLDFIPFFGSAKLLASGAKQAAQSQDEWNRQKGVLFRHIREIEVAMQDAISEVNIDHFGDLEIVTANKLNFIKHSRRTLQEVLDKYKQKSKELREATDKWSEKHGEHVNLLTPEYESDEFWDEV